MIQNKSRFLWSEVLKKLIELFLAEPYFVPSFSLQKLCQSQAWDSSTVLANLEAFWI